MQSAPLTVMKKLPASCCCGAGQTNGGGGFDRLLDNGAAFGLSGFVYLFIYFVESTLIPLGGKAG